MSSRAEGAQAPASEHGAGLSTLEYAPLCETMGRSFLAPVVFNCSTPDTGNMEVLARCGTPEPQVASSDATNIESRIERDGDQYVINGHNWYATNAIDPRCEIAIFMGKSDPDNADRHRQQSMILVPMDAPGVKVMRAIPVFGFYGMPDRASEVSFTNVRVPASNMLLGEGRSFVIAQGRLGPGRIHHGMWLIGMPERALERIAECRIAIEQASLLTLNAAHRVDAVSNKVAKAESAMIKVAAPAMAGKVIDWAIQAHGGGDTSNDFGLAHAHAMARVLRLADGPDDVHRQQLGRLALKKHH